MSSGCQGSNRDGDTDRDIAFCAERHSHMPLFESFSRQQTDHPSLLTEMKIMMRLMTIATLLMLLICFLVSATIAMADPAEIHVVQDASRDLPADQHDENLA